MKLEGSDYREAEKKKKEKKREGRGGLGETDVGMILAPCLALLGETTASDSTRHDTVGLRARASARRGTAERARVRESEGVSSEGEGGKKKKLASCVCPGESASRFSLAFLLPLCYFFLFVVVLRRASLG